MDEEIEYPHTLWDGSLQISEEIVEHPNGDRQYVPSERQVKILENLQSLAKPTPIPVPPKDYKGYGFVVIRDETKWSELPDVSLDPEMPLSWEKATEVIAIPSEESWRPQLLIAYHPKAATEGTDKTQPAFRIMGNYQHERVIQIPLYEFLVFLKISRKDINAIFDEWEIEEEEELSADGI